MAVFAVAVALHATTASAGNPCGGYVCWGAIGVGENGLTARASNFRTAQEAADRADRVCLGKCETIQVFHSGCGAIVTSREAIFSGFSEKRDAAIAEAETHCKSNGGKFCRLRVWACTN